MMRHRALVVGLAALLTLGSARFASAEESTMELQLGGLVFAKSPDIPNVGIDSEEIVITPDVVTVKYRFVNHGPAPANLTLTFPLPELDFSDPSNSLT